MKKIPEWIENMIIKDRRLSIKYTMSREYLRQSKSIQFIDGERSEKGGWKRFRYVVNSKKYGRYWVKYENGRYECNCPFFKGNPICSHILGICQKTGIWPEKEKQLKDRREAWR